MHHNIYLAYNQQGSLSDGQKVAVKRLIILSSHTDDEDEKAFDREVELMSKLRHGNLVQLLAYCKDGSDRLLVYEYMKNRSLNFYIHGMGCKYAMHSVVWRYGHSNLLSVQSSH